MTYAKKTLSEIKLIHGDYGNFIKGQKLDKRKEKKYKTPPYKDLAASNEIDGEPLDEKCWPGYEKKGMKTMFGKRYPNCVKKKKTRKEEYSDWRSELENIQEKAKKRKSTTFNQDKLNQAIGGKDAKGNILNKETRKRLFQQSRGKLASKVPGFKGAAKLLGKLGPKGKLVAGGILAGGALTAALLNRNKDKKKVPVVPYQGTNVIERDPNSPDFGKVKQSTASPEIKSRNIKATSYYDKKDLSRSGPLAKSFYGPGGIGKKSFSLDNPNPSGFVTIKRDYLKPKVSTNTQGVYGKPYKINGKTYKPPAYGSSVKEEALSKKQQKFFGIVRAVQKGEQVATTPEVAKAAEDMKKSDVKKFASTKHKGLPEKKKVDEVFLPEILDKKDVPHVKKLVKKLRDGSKTHAKQADELEVAMKTENTAIESELIIQDWNKDDIKFTEIETVDIIKAKPLKENKFVDFVKNIGKSDVNKEIESLKDRIGPPPDSFKKELDKYDPSDDTRGIKDKNKKKKTKLHGVSVKSLKDFEKEAMRIRTEQKSNWREELDEGAVLPFIAKALGAIKGATMTKGGLFALGAGSGLGSALPAIIAPKTMTTLAGLGLATQGAGLVKQTVRKQAADKENQNLRMRMGMGEQKSNWREELGEDWQKVNRKDKTDGLSKAAVKAYRRENPGSKLQTAVTKDPKKLKKGSKSAKRRLSFCRRMKGMKKKLTSAKTRRDPDSRINKALRRWNC